MASGDDKAKGASFLWEPNGQRAIVSPERFTEEQRNMARAGREFSEKEIRPRLAEIESKKAGVTPELLKRAGELGLLMVDVPEEYGGLGLDKTTSMLLAEQFGSVGSFSVSLGAHTGIGTLPIVYFGNDDQKRRYLPDLATGKKIAAYALTEEGSGSDALAARTRASLSPDGRHYILNGTKQFITNAGFADVFVVFAKVDGEKFTGFIVDRTTPGLTVGPEEHKMGIRGSSTCSLLFEDAKVPVGNVLGEIGKGHRIAFNTLNLGRMKLGVATTGACKATLSLATRYAKDRKQFGKPIAAYGMVSQKLAEMALSTFITETTGYRTTGLVDAALEGCDSDRERVSAIEEFTVEASIIKIIGSEALNFCADECVQVHGGYGFIEEFEAERYLRDSRINRIFEGTNEINRLIIPGTLLKRASKGELPLLEHSMMIRERTAKGDVPGLGKGPFAAEEQVVERCKWLALYVTSVAVETYMMTVADQQEVLGELADILGRVYAVDSVLSRVRQIDETGDARTKEVARELLTAYAPRAYGFVVHSVRHVLMDIVEGESLQRHLAAVNHLRFDWPAKVIECKRRLAGHVLAAEGYPL
jgi:alkylation response protein AidB-like acyl-CoA dehydrogenase